MKILFFAFIVYLFLCPLIIAQTGEINIIPKPKSVSRLKGDFTFSRKTKIVANTDEARRSAGFLNDYLLKTYNFKLEIVTVEPKDGAIVFDYLKPLGTPPDSANGIVVAPKFVRLYGKDAAGHFYALQSFLQLLPVNFKDEAKIPALDLVDEPRFRYRGMHLDVSRHFMPVEFVKKYIDLMAQYKFNYFHWHLTDDQGWRIEIKKYPRLTEIGSKRKESHEGRYSPTFKGDGVPVEGFYTQEQVKDVVAYAKSRHITVIPEIELPGHSSAALAAYPELGCKTDYQYKVQMTWGIFKEVFCPTETTFKFLEDVLAETIALFPDSPYIHIGGDEVLKDHWKESAFVQELKKKENLKDEHEVQSYFIRRMEKFINSKGKRIIGWDEILEGGLAPNAVVMSWRGMKGGIEAAKAKHDVIMTPTEFAYLDYGQGDPKFEPINIGNYVPLQKVYSFEPVPKELTEDERKYILGGQGNVWTEYMKTPEKVEYMVFPRMLALSEVLWSAPENRNFEDFQKRLANQFWRLDKQNVNYRIPEPLGLENRILTDSIKTIITLKPSVNKGKIFYTLDGSEPNENSILYEEPLLIGLEENKRIDLKTIVVNESGRKSVVYGSTIWRRKPFAPVVEPTDKKAGVNFAFYKQEFSNAADIEKATTEQKGETKSIQLGQFREKIADKMPFGLSFEGLIKVAKDEIYEFELESLGGAEIWIDNEKIVGNEFQKDRQAKTGIVPLKAGYHRIRLKYFKGAGEAVFGLRWGIKGQGLSRIYGGELFN